MAALIVLSSLLHHFVRISLPILHDDTHRVGACGQLGSGCFIYTLAMNIKNQRMTIVKSQYISLKIKVFLAPNIHRRESLLDVNKRHFF